MGSTSALLSLHTCALLVTPCLIDEKHTGMIKHLLFTHLFQDDTVRPVQGSNSRHMDVCILQLPLARADEAGNNDIHVELLNQDVTQNGSHIALGNACTRRMHFSFVQESNFVQESEAQKVAGL